MSTLVTLRIPRDLLEQIDETAKLEGMSRSQVIISLMRDQDPRPTKAETEAIKKVEKKAERVRVERQTEAPKRTTVCHVCGRELYIMDGKLTCTNSQCTRYMRVGP